MNLVGSARPLLFALALLSGLALLGACDDDDDATVIDIEGRDFAFGGAPDELDAGSYTFTFENAGAEFHELALFRVPEGLTLAEALELPEEDSPFPDGIVFAAPGEAASASLTLDLRPGSYALLCFVENDAGPHAFQGMQAVIRVE